MNPKRVQQVGVWRIPCGGPGDLSGVKALIDTGEIVASEIVAVMGKTEGNGCVNDFTREYASTAWCHLLAPALGCTPEAVHGRVALVMSGGTEGVLAPHFTVFARRWVPEASEASAGLGKRLVVGVAHTRDFLPEELGRGAQVDATAQAVAEAMRDAGIDRRKTCTSCRSSARCSRRPRWRRHWRAAPRRPRTTATNRWAIRAALRRWAWRLHWARSRVKRSAMRA
jgi:cyanuric acid amidohydrolase